MDEENNGNKKEVSWADFKIFQPGPGFHEHIEDIEDPVERARALLAEDGSGFREMADNMEIARWSRYAIGYKYEGADDIEYFEVPENTKVLVQRAFENCSNLKKIKLPEGLQAIGDFAFYKCTSLEEIIIPDSVEVIGSNAFCGCEKLKTVKLPGAGGRAVVEGQTGSSVQFHESGQPESMGKLEKLEDSLFCDCLSLENINIPNGIKEIESSVFSNCVSLKNITLPESIEEIGYNAFSGCTKLESINLPANMEVLEAGVFENCYSLQSVKMPVNLQVISIGSFSNCKSLKSLCLPESILDFQECAFEGCSSLENIIMDKEICLKEQTFDMSVFDDFMSDESLTDDSLAAESMGEMSFADESMGQAYSQGAVSIGKGCFTGCKNLKAVGKTVCHDNLIIVGNTVYSYLDRGPAVVKIPEGVTKIGYGSFTCCNNVEEIYFPQTLKEIEPGSFSDCKNLKQIYLPEGFSEFSSTSFEGCYNLENMTVKNNIILINNVAVEYIRNREDPLEFVIGRMECINIPQGTKAIVHDFFDLLSPKNVILPEGITEIKKKAFHNKIELEYIKLPSTIKYIADYAFGGCNFVKPLEIPEGAVVSPKAFKTVYD